ncbi:MAG: DsbA family protein [Gammaproteobacteria bacterium]|nr:DsbA family protein [Gammaproteobacteria bacterium]
MPQQARLIYVHDPMCSWCWGFRPAFDALCAALDGRVAVTRLLGGLAADSDAAMPDAMQKHLQQTWRRIQQRIPGTRFNFDFWRDCRPRRSTWPACRAVIAARTLDPGAEPAMIDAIQRAYYLDARNPSDSATLIALAASLGLDDAAFAARLDDAATHATLAAEIAAARQMGVDSFPSLRLQTAGGTWPVTVDYTDSAPMHATVETLLAA